MPVLNQPPNPPQPDPTQHLLDYQYVSQFSNDTVGLQINVAGVPTDADGNNVTVTMYSSQNEPIFSQAASRMDTGAYTLQFTPAQSGTLGYFRLDWAMSIGGVPQLTSTYIEIGQANPFYDSLDPAMQVLVNNVWMRFEDTFDSPQGGPHLQVYFQTNMSRGRLAQLLHVAVGFLNTMAQPFTSFDISTFPVANWGPLLEQCVTLDTLILRSDLSWVPAGDLQVGDQLVGFDEEWTGGKFRTSTVEHMGIRPRECLTIETSMGPITVTEEHPFMTRHARGIHANGRTQWKYEWKKACDLNPERDEIASIGEPWEQDLSHDGGYLAGLFDADGCWTTSTVSDTRKSEPTYQNMSRLLFTQNPGTVNDLFTDLMKERGFLLGQYPSTHSKTIVSYIQGGILEQMRALGSIRPPRLLEHTELTSLWEGKAHRSIPLQGAKILSIRSVGTQEIAALQTSTGTYISNGMLSHNCLYIETLKHLIRSYTEQPLPDGVGIARMDRRDYTDRWRQILDMEMEWFKSQLDVFKISQMGLGRPRVLVSGGVYGTYGPTRLPGNAAARPMFWSRNY